MIPDLLGALYDALLDIPGVRFVMSLASPAWRPLWAITWVVGLVYVVVRILESLQRRGLYRILAGGQAAERPIGGAHAAVPHAAVPPSASAAPAASPAPAAADGGLGAADWDVQEPAPGPTLSELVKRDRPKPPSLAARAALGAAALCAVLALLSLLSDGDPEPAVDRTASGNVAQPVLDSPAAIIDAPPFTFAARGWRSAAGSCVATLEVTGGAQPAGPLTMFVMDSTGTVLGAATLRVGSLTPGAFHEFRFPGVDCDAITQWQVQG